MPPLLNDGTTNKYIFPDGTIGWEDHNSIPRVKFGWGELEKLGRALCRMVNTFAPLIKNVFGSNETIMMLLDVTIVACTLIQDVASPINASGTVPENDDIKNETLEALQAIITKYGGA